MEIKKIMLAQLKWHRILHVFGWLIFMFYLIDAGNRTYDFSVSHYIHHGVIPHQYGAISVFLFVIFMFIDVFYTFPDVKKKS